MYDIVLEKVLIYDGSGGKPYRGNLAVEDGRIAAIGDCSGPARRVIHGEGLAAAPGLIDVHTHNDNTLLWDRQMASALYQGVTTQVTGMCGLGLIPSRREEIPHILGFYGAILGGHGEKTPPYSDIDQYLSLAEGAAVNVAAAVNHSALRIFAGGWNSVPYGEIAPVMKEELRRNLRMGAVGLSVGLDYFPACTLNVTTEELVDLAKVAAEEDALLLTHIRPAGYGIDPLAEMDQVARQSGVKLHILHTKTAYPATCGHPEAISDRFDKANREGADVTMEFYPYPCWETYALYFVPYWVQEGGFASMMARLTDPALRPRLAREIEERYRQVVGIYQPAVCSCARGCPQYEGLTFDQLCALRSHGMGEMILDLLVETKLSFGALASDVADPAVARQLQDDYMTLFQKPYYTVSSDSITAGGFPHPRVFGTFGKIFRLTREYGLPLEQTVYKLTRFNADRFGLTGRGRLEAGCWADVMVFDPASIRDRSDYTLPRQPAEGVAYLLVNGRVALEEGRPNGILAGQALRRSRA